MSAAHIYALIDDVILDLQNINIPRFDKSTVDDIKYDPSEQKKRIMNIILPFKQTTHLIEWSQSFRHTIPYGKFITGTFDLKNNFIIVYQAFNSNIANYASQSQKFIGCDHYNETRMTWVKSNFLWMMYRSGWGKKDKNQSNILAIYLKLDCFETFISECVYSKYNNALPYDEKEHKKKITSKDRIVLQWDPHHSPTGGKIEGKRAIQLGMKGKYLNQFHDSILCIQDITSFVKEQHNKMKSKQPFYVVKEYVLDVNDEIAKYILIGDKNAKS
eukprot:265788_1